MSIRKVAYLGIGVMGRGMVPNLVRAGYRVSAWNRTPERAEAMREHGAEVALTIGEAVRGADLVLSCLSDDAAVEAAMFAEGGVLAHVAAGQTVVDMSTVHPDLSLRQHDAFAGRGASFLDAPVFGSKNEAANGGLWIVVGGADEVFERVRPVLEVLSETLHHMGGPGMGARMKLVGNLVVAMQLEALGEAMVLATKAGLDARKVLEVLHVTDFKSPIFDGVGGALIRRDFETHFALKHMLKDANLIARFAQDLNAPIPAAAAARETIKGAVNQGWGEENASAMIKMLELQGGAEVRA
jgi:3-hydroxyisobutyrate dehydrogenase-like beta-hydroxyacid dehydrogenase